MKAAIIPWILPTCSSLALNSLMPATLDLASDRDDEKPSSAARQVWEWDLPSGIYQATRRDDGRVCGILPNLSSFELNVTKTSEGQRGQIAAILNGQNINMSQSENLKWYMRAASQFRVGSKEYRFSDCFSLGKTHATEFAFFMYALRQAARLHPHVREVSGLFFCKEAKDQEVSVCLQPIRKRDYVIGCADYLTLARVGPTSRSAENVKTRKRKHSSEGMDEGSPSGHERSVDGDLIPVTADLLSEFIEDGHYVEEEASFARVSISTDPGNNRRYGALTLAGERPVVMDQLEWVTDERDDQNCLRPRLQNDEQPYPLVKRTYYGRLRTSPENGMVVLR
ncbi:hypothetical protein FOZ63_001391, partial [Perkinsus olseni]